MRGLPIAVLALGVTPHLGCDAANVVTAGLLTIVIAAAVVFVLVGKVAAQIRDF